MPKTGHEFHVTFVRHGETDYNAKGILQGQGIDAVLNNKGIKQAKSIGRYGNNV